MAAHRPRLRPRRRLAAELRRLAGALTRWADGADPAPLAPPAERRPGEPPEHWLALVRERAPELLEGGGLGYSLDPGRAAWRQAPTAVRAPGPRPGPRRPAPARREARPVTAALTSAGAPPGGTESGGSSDGDAEPPAAPTRLLSRVVARLRRRPEPSAPARPTGQGWGGPVGPAGDVPGSHGAPAPAYPAGAPPHLEPAGAAPAVGSRGAPAPACAPAAAPRRAVAAPAPPVTSHGAPQAGAGLPLVGRPAWPWPAGGPVESHGAAGAFDVLPPAPPPVAPFPAAAVERPPSSGPVAAHLGAAPWPTLPPAPEGARVGSEELTAADGRWPDLPDDRELRAFDAVAAAPDRDRLARLAQEQRGYD